MTEDKSPDTALPITEEQSNAPTVSPETIPTTTPPAAEPATPAPQPTKEEILKENLAFFAEGVEKMTNFLYEFARPSSDLTLALSNLNDAHTWAKQALARN